MNLETRKIEFIQEFLKLKNEEVVSRFENLLEKERDLVIYPDHKPMTKEDLNKRIDQSEADFRNNRYKRSTELLFKYE